MRRVSIEVLMKSPEVFSDAKYGSSMEEDVDAFIDDFDSEIMLRLSLLHSFFTFIESVCFSDCLPGTVQRR